MWYFLCMQIMWVYIIYSICSITGCSPACMFHPAVCLGWPDLPESCPWTLSAVSSGWPWTAQRDDSATHDSEACWLEAEQKQRWKWVVQFHTLILLLWRWGVCSLERSSYLYLLIHRERIDKLITLTLAHANRVVHIVLNSQQLMVCNHNHC